MVYFFALIGYGRGAFFDRADFREKNDRKLFPGVLIDMKIVIDVCDAFPRE